MPKATTNPNDTAMVWLKTLPAQGDEEAGFVELRRMSYGEVLRRRQMGSTMTLQSDNNKDMMGVMEMIQRKSTEFEFARCIINHNLTDDHERPLDFKASHTFDILDPRVGEEIGQWIDKMNQYEEVVDNAGNSLTVLDVASSSAPSLTKSVPDSSS